MITAYDSTMFSMSPIPKIWAFDLKKTLQNIPLNLIHSNIEIRLFCQPPVLISAE